jgi:hypothetical protein
MADSAYQIEINPPGEIPGNFRLYLFNQPFHILKQPCSQVYTFYLIHKKKRLAFARFSLFCQEEKGISPCRGTFGSIEMHPQLPVQHLDYFIQFIDAFAVKQGIRQVEIKSYPFCYDQQVSTLITASLLRQQYRILHTDLNYHLPVTAGAFKDLIHPSEKRRLQKSIAKGFVFGEEKDPDLELIYQMIVQGRTRKGYPVSMNFTDFRQLFMDFPGIYKIFSVKDQSVIAAVTVAVQINSQILYYFLPAHDPVYNTYSPMVLLIKGLYDYCQQAGFTLLDLGISTDKGVPNYGLMRFKQNLGALSSLKLSFFKMLIDDPTR